VLHVVFSRYLRVLPTNPNLYPSQSQIKLCCTPTLRTFSTVIKSLVPHRTYSTHIDNSSSTMTSFSSLQCRLFVFLLLVVCVQSMGFTNIFDHVHHRVDEVSERMNGFLDDEENEHLAFFPRGIRTVQDVSTNAANKRKRTVRKSQQKHPHTTLPSYATEDEEIMERLVELQN